LRLVARIIAKEATSFTTTATIMDTAEVHYCNIVKLEELVTWVAEAEHIAAPGVVVTVEAFIRSTTVPEY
jgi:hypothetical protein